MAMTRFVSFCGDSIRDFKREERHRRRAEDIERKGNEILYGFSVYSSRGDITIFLLVCR